MGMRCIGCCLTLGRCRFCSFFGWLSIDHPHNNVHNIRICRLLVEARVLSTGEVAELRALQRVRGGRAGRWFKLRAERRG